ncbi:hypothetical protein SAMN02745221_02085 [Thermosyntropha lipolytica DSM 11003]|uniref:DUF116 domain-containing protein n=1 Tax=Thermosyntropha lipolytica DSM 11003 TaxID=1123382 RepID=A0A1M5RQU5_9FIRM|nr:DUF116 domain-containing protein [Thermosyntropha lipolytica]SHH28584.1 hypothetical protein SAMN02745221_02085 [Thermosyntropha lipolytica DSM 11003]
MRIKKRVYIGLLGGSLLFLLLAVFLIWYMVINRHMAAGKIIFMFLTIAAGLAFIILGAGLLAIIIMIWRFKTIPSLENLGRIVNDTLFPLVLLVGRFLGVQKEKILSSYIEVNNFMVKAKKLLLPGEQIMILAPHCLQDAACPHKITINVENCKECGKCKVGELKKLAREHKAVLKVATGGTLARKFIKEIKPKAVIAIACERDLALGIQDTSAIPVLGVLNFRPHGPCFNTDVDLKWVENALITFKKGGG